jgi:hypothetical protein
MLQRSERPLSDDERQEFERRRKNDPRGTRFEPKFVFLGSVPGACGLGRDPHHGWPVFALLIGGALMGLLVDYRRYRRECERREAAAAERWNPLIEARVVEHVVADASKALVRESDEQGTAWFLQVSDSEVLCVWNWGRTASEHLEIDLVPGEPPSVLTMTWSGKTLTPMRPSKRFGPGDREPEQCEVLHGSLEELDSLLRDERRSPSGPGEGVTPAVAKLGDEMAALGFYKFVDAEWRHDIDREMNHGAYEWYQAAGRTFWGDAEALAEGGVQDLLQSMQSALEIEGVVLGAMEESYDERGYVLRVGSDEYTMWGPAEANRSWELTTTRTITMINEWLAKAGSDERLSMLYEAVFVLLTPAQRDAIEDSGVFPPTDIPGEF